MATPSCSAADRAAVLAHVLVKWADKRTNRKALQAGADYQVALSVHGSIGRGKVEETIRGTLTVGHNQQKAQTYACDQTHLVAALVADLTEAARDKLFARILGHFREQHALPDVMASELSAAKSLLEQLRDSKTVPVKGNVRFISEAEEA